MNVITNLQSTLPLKVSRVLSSTLLWVGLAAGVWAIPVVVQAQQLDAGVRDAFLADPVDDVERDPLLPSLDVERAFSPLELYDLDQGLDLLDRQAQLLLNAGEMDDAFELWLREVRLRRVMGLAEELAALDRVSRLAWEAQRSTEIRLMSLRLREVWQAGVLADSLAESELLQIAQLFETLRDEPSILAVYAQLADRAAQRGDGITQRDYLAKLAEQQLQWFNYDEAAAIYQRLLSDATAREQSVQQINWLRQLIYSYQQNDDYAQAATAQRQLAELYQAQGDVEKLPELLVALGNNYAKLNQSQTAIEYYRSAYSYAQRLQQYSFSSQVLLQLGQLYRDLNELDQAIAMYDLLVRVEGQSYNTYGIMNAYDLLGTVYRDQGDRASALAAFEAGLTQAQQLDHRQDYFQSQIQTVTP
jgi:tetratricopeptide (TPR) repeat protein